MHGNVPTNLSLISRFVNVEPAGFSQCGEMVESTNHGLRDCPHSHDCWESCLLKIDLRCYYGGTSFVTSEYFGTPI